MTSDIVLYVYDIWAKVLILIHFTCYTCNMFDVPVMKQDQMVRYALYKPGGYLSIKMSSYPKNKFPL